MLEFQDAKQFFSKRLKIKLVLTLVLFVKIHFAPNAIKLK